MDLGSMDGLVSVPTWFRYTVTTWFKLSVAVAEGTSYSYRPGILPAQTSCVKPRWKPTVVMERRRGRRRLDMKKAVALARFLKEMESDSDADDPSQPSRTSTDWNETRLSQYVHPSMERRRNLTPSGSEQVCKCIYS